MEFNAKILGEIYEQKAKELGLFSKENPIMTFKDEDYVCIKVKDWDLYPKLLRDTMKCYCEKFV